MVLLEFLDNFALPVATRQILRSSSLRTCGGPLTEYECRHFLIRKSQDLPSNIIRASHLNCLSGIFEDHICSS